MQDPSIPEDGLLTPIVNAWIMKGLYGSFLTIAERAELQTSLYASLMPVLKPMLKQLLTF